MSIEDSERVRLRTQQHMEPRLPQWRAQAAVTLADPNLSDEDAWNQCHRAAYLLVRDSFEMAKYGEIRTREYQDLDVEPDTVAHRAPLIRQWRQDSASLVADTSVSDKDVFSRLSRTSYSLTASVARWRIAQHEARQQEVNGGEL